MGVEPTHYQHTSEVTANGSAAPGDADDAAGPAETVPVSAGRRSPR